MKRLLPLLIASAFAASSAVAVAQEVSSSPATVQSQRTLQQQRSEAFGDTERVLQQESRSSAAGPGPTDAAQAPPTPGKAVRSGDAKKDFAEEVHDLQERSQP
jgi:hypothetical protein